MVAIRQCQVKKAGLYIMKAPQNTLFERAARGEVTERPPVWLMRQAGRTDPAYNRLKDEAGLPLEELFRHADLAAEISLLPKRIGVDALIYFQDILTPLAPMGAPFLFRPGPVLEQPVRTESDVDRLRLYDVARELPFIPAIFERIDQSLDGALPVLGFAGAPLTLAVFLAEGKSFGDVAPQATAMIREAPQTLHRLLRKLTKMTIDYLLLQVESGVAAVQLFESAAFLLDEAAYREFALPYQQQVFAALKGRVKTIVFARDWSQVADLGAAGADIVSLPSSVTIGDAREVLGADQVVQGNLSNRLLAEGTPEAIEEATNACIAAGECRGHIFNLDHGLLRHTPFEHVQHVVRVVRESGPHQ
jgi:uroporphyrinogen decarboxylase